MSGKKKKKQNSKKDLSEEVTLPESSYLNNQTYGNDSAWHSDPQFTIAFDREFHARMGKFWAFSPAAISGAYFDWLTHITFSPGKQMSLLDSAAEKAINLSNYCLYVTSGIKTDYCIKATPYDRRFDNNGWDAWPYNIYAQAFLLTEAWWTEATSNVRGVSQHHSAVLPFMTRQFLDIWAPSNFPFTNPQVVEATLQTNGVNFIKGAKHLVEVFSRFLKKESPAGIENFEVGKDVAITKGKVVYQNRLIELIQYSPQTQDVYAEPVLIVPAWIMKYYILDLSEHNSLVKYLLENNHTVFIISWKNPGSKDRDIGFEDYANLGVKEALKAITAITGEEEIHGVGYCLGGTLLSSVAAAMCGSSQNVLKTITLFAAQTDFEEAGELLLFIDESQIAFLEDIMWDKGYLDSSRMAGTFDMLRSYDLIWSKMIGRYLLGEKRALTDLMAWNADATRMPYKMHSEFLRNLFLHNSLTTGKFNLGGQPVSLYDIKVPIFVVATQKDHVSPWKSVHKIHLFTDTEITFVLTSGGHNAGIVSEPGHRNRTYQLSVHNKTDEYSSPDEWFEKAPQCIGSWWATWSEWLESHSSDKITPPSMGNPAKGYRILRDAPGLYVMER